VALVLPTTGASSSSLEASSTKSSFLLELIPRAEDLRRLGVGSVCAGVRAFSRFFFCLGGILNHACHTQCNNFY
jgi:hypothetical protein